MGLASCPDCNGKVSDLAEKCPHCGRPSNVVTPVASSPPVSTPRKAASVRRLPSAAQEARADRGFQRELLTGFVAVLAVLVVVGVVVQFASAAAMDLETAAVVVLAVLAVLVVIGWLCMVIR